jgi:hypothetical protein
LIVGFAVLAVTSEIVYQLLIAVAVAAGAGGSHPGGFARCCRNPQLFRGDPVGLADGTMWVDVQAL